MLIIKRELNLKNKLLKIIDDLLKPELKETSLYEAIISIIKNKWIFYFYKKIDDKLLDILDIKEDIESYNKLNIKEKNEIDLYYILLSMFWLLNISNIENLSYSWPLFEQGYIFILKDQEIINIIEYDKIIEEVQNTPPFFPVKFKKFKVEL